MSQYNVSVLVNGNIAGYRRAMQDAERTTRSFSSLAQREFAKIREFARSTQGQLAGLGLSVGFTQLQRNAAQLQKTLTQVRLTAGMSAREQQEAYQAMFDMVKRNGGVIEETVGGFNSLVQAGLKFKEAMAATEAINMARAVTGASDSVLASALTVGSANYGFDLAKAGVATQMLDKMAVAGRLGNAELENLSNIFPRVAQRAQSAGFSFDKTLAFIEGLSQIERQPERLATLADSTLRLFTNAKYAKDAEKAVGVKFFQADGSRRDPLAILEDMRKKYQALTTDAQRFQFISKGFQNTDLDTQRGIQALLSGRQLDDIRDFERQIASAGGTLARDLATATDNAVDQASRLKNVLREAAEDFARPLNDAFTRGTKWLLDSKGVTGGQLLAGGAAGAAGLYAASRLLPPMLRSVAGRFGGVGAGVATGKALEAAAGVTPVYVTNWSEMSGGGGGGLLGTAGAAAGGAASVGFLARMRGLIGAGALVGSAPLGVTAGAGAGGLAAIGAGVGAAGLAGYGAGSLLYKAVENTTFVERIEKILAAFGNENAQRSVAINESLRSTKVGGEITVRVLSDPSVPVQHQVKPFNGTRMSADVGHSNQAAGY
ncbi:phage tail tape measure protein [Variovorax sp. VNK109]|uniref:phage tail tape measure protein n=1 Tax=Variovorax sp. VNK109 TaxID=3400919 RepID=UPI003C03F14B